MHGWVHDEFVPHTSLEPVARLLDDDFRVCVYDRRNVGASETVDAVQTPDDMRHDMEEVLEAGGVEPPYLLLAGSFGGLVAYDFLNHHPEGVVGVVFEDAMVAIYLAAAQEPRVNYDWVTPEYVKRYPDLLQGFVDRFAPGELRWVEAPHYMEPVVPDGIALTVRDVAAAASE